jgi:hypothetical protein
MCHLTFEPKLDTMTFRSDVASGYRSVMSNSSVAGATCG